jgi:hypothetical protein
MDDEKITKHESYGCISMSTNFGGDKSLFGSSIPHSEYISIRINEAEDHRYLNQNTHVPKRELIEINMSKTQFAEFITSMGKGTGVPCTITRVNGEKREPCPFTPKAEVHRQEFEAHLDDIKKEMDEAIAKTHELFAKKTLNKSDKESLLRALEHLRTQVISNSGYQVQMFNEQMDKTLFEAKAELEAFANKNNILMLKEGE